MKIQIKTIAGSVLFEGDFSAIKDALVSAVKQGADLRGAYLRGAYLQGADLQGADLRGAYLQGADLQGADLQGADLQGADLQGAKNADLAIAMTRILPDGDLIGWKKCQGGVIVKLRIPSDSKRSHAFGRKCRCEFADVLEVIGGEVGLSQHGDSFPVVKYRVGQRVTCDKWCDDYTQECAGGIHFMITRLEAENY